MKKLVPWLKQLSIVQKLLVGLGAFILIGALSSNNKPANLNITPTSKKGAASSQQIKPKKPTLAVTTKTDTETQSIPFTSTTVNNSTLAQGTTKVTTSGVDGSETLTYEVTYTNGQQTNKKLVHTTVNVQPVTQVTSVGTYVTPPPPSCPNGTYVNSEGNTVCSPYSSPSAPAGATAQCADGTYSFSQSRSGTCSHHGGVTEWL